MESRILCPLAFLGKGGGQNMNIFVNGTSLTDYQNSFIRITNAVAGIHISHN